MAISTNDFLSGKYDDFFKVMQPNAVSKFTPFKADAVSINDIYRIWTSDPTLPQIVSHWQGTISEKSFEVVLSINENNSDTTAKRKELLKNKTYQLVYSKKRWSIIENNVVNFIAREGNAVLTFNEFDEPVIESINDYNVYYDSYTQEAEYRLVKDGSEILKGLKHGIDLWHFKDWIFTDYPVAPSRINNGFNWFLLNLHGLQANVGIMENSLVGKTLLSMSEKATALNESKGEDKEGKTWFGRLMDGINSKHKGAKKAGGVAIIPEIVGFYQLSKSNKEMEFTELLKEAPQKIAILYGLSPADLGIGETSTYNNVAQFNYAKWDKIGVHLTEMLSECLNEFCLPKWGITTTNTFYVHYKAPSSPDSVETQKQAREDYKNGLITRNEYRELIDMPTLEEDGFMSDFAPAPALPTEKPTDTKAVDATFEVKKKIEEFANETISQKTLKTKQAKKFETTWETKIAKQLEAYVKDFKKLKEVPEEVKLPKIETFYSFANLEKDLADFARVGCDSFQKDKRIKNKKVAEFALAEGFLGMPDYILQAIEYRTYWLLKGNAKDLTENQILLGDDWQGFAGLDVATSQQVLTIVTENADKGIDEIARILTEQIPLMAKYRAELIARTEITNAVMGSQFELYRREFGKNATSTWLTVGDARVGDDHRENDGKTVKLGKEFPSGETRPGQRPNCRCALIYNLPDNY